MSKRAQLRVAIQTTRATAAVVCILLLPSVTSPAFADAYQEGGAPPTAQYPQNQQPLFSPDQLSNLVAPIALYPDPLLGEILAASTYPLELVEAGQWVRQNGNLRGQASIEAAKAQDWDPSVQVLVAFPDAIALLNRDIRWTTDLGNAFLAQQADVMNAIQALRIQAQNNGRLRTTPQQVVTTDERNGQSAVSIEPANPSVIYPPVYNPASVWGSQIQNAPGAYAYGGYGNGYGGYGYGSDGGGEGFGSGIDIAGLFSGLLNFASWGWSLGWFTHSLSLVSLFFNALGSVFGSHGFGGSAGYGGAFGASSGLALWAHNPTHRLGVAYPRGYVSANARMNSPRPIANAIASNRSTHENWQSFGSPIPGGNRIAENRAAASTYRAAPSYAAGVGNSAYRTNSWQTPAAATPRSFAPRQSSSQSSQRYFAQSQPQQQHYSEPRMSSSQTSQKYSAPHYSAPHYSTPKSAPHYSAPKFSAPHVSAPKHSGGGHSSKSSHKR